MAGNLTDEQIKEIIHLLMMQHPGIESECLELLLKSYLESHEYDLDRDY